MESIPQLRQSFLAGRSVSEVQHLQAVFGDAWDTEVLGPERIRTGCIYEGQPRDSYQIAVMRFDPRPNGRRMTQFHDWRPEFAPSFPLLTAYRKVDTYGQRQLQWRPFTERYLAELDALPTQLLLAFVEGLSTMSCRYKIVTLLCCEHPTAGDERRVRCHRRLLRSWLLGQPIVEEAEEATDGKNT